MTVLLNCKDVRLDYPVRRVLDAVTLGIDTGDRIGIVGVNGGGKSSLLGVLDGSILPTAGEATRRGGCTVARLAQTDTLDDAQTIAQATVGDLPEYEWASNRVTREIIDALLADLPWQGLVGELSGGQRRRVDLARLLIGSWDILMLDEPTNHLDMKAISWLASHLKTRWAPGEGALLVVTHDRWFLDEVCSSMWEVHDGLVEPFEGGFSAYVLQRVEREQAAALAEQKRRNLLRRELAWLSRGAQARATKPKFHVQAARDLIADVPPLRNTLELKQVAMSRLGKQVVDLVDASVRYDETTVIKPLEWIIGPGERVGILGLNGSGKSSVLALINGTLTLPGIAGFVLTIGTAVDANVLINERIREERRRGRSVVQSVELGYKEASRTIFEANVTHAISGVIMFLLGSGPVKGFAVVLLIGIATSVFTAVTFTRMLVALWLRKKRPQTINI